MRKVAILLVLLACDSESEDELRCRDWLVCFDECRAFDDAGADESQCVGDCDPRAWDDEIAKNVWLNDAWLQGAIDGIYPYETFDPMEVYDALRDARRACYAER